MEKDTKEKSFGGVLVGAGLGIAGLLAYQAGKKHDIRIPMTESSVNAMKKELKESPAVKGTPKGKYKPMPYKVSLERYGHIKDVKDYPKKIRWYEPNGEYENRTFEKWDTKKKDWVEIDSAEFSYYEVSAEDNTSYEYKQIRPKAEKGKSLMHHYLLTKKMEKGGDVSGKKSGINWIITGTTI